MADRGEVMKGKEERNAKIKLLIEEGNRERSAFPPLFSSVQFCVREGDKREVMEVYIQPERRKQRNIKRKIEKRKRKKSIESIDEFLMICNWREEKGNKGKKELKIVK